MLVETRTKSRNRALAKDDSFTIRQNSSSDLIPKSTVRQQVDHVEAGEGEEEEEIRIPSFRGPRLYSKETLINQLLEIE